MPVDLARHFEAVDGDLRIRGTRVDLSAIVDAWRAGLSPEAIADQYPSVTLEQVYASLAWSIAHRSELDEAQACRAPTPRPTGEAPVVARLRALLHARRPR
jgi:uncharacterized protein (DUF433 family)